MDNINKLFDYVDDKVGPDRVKFPIACQESREMVMDCVIHSECFDVAYVYRPEIQKFQVLHARRNRQTMQSPPV